MKTAVSPRVVPSRFGAEFTPTTPTHAHFLLFFEGGIVRVCDMDDGCRSVTNDAEHVVRNILAHLRQVAELRLPIVYEDTDGRWDQLAHDGVQFTGFVSLGASTEEDAVRLVREGYTA